MTQQLTDRERTILSIEGRVWIHPNSKVQAIHDELGISKGAYLVALNQLIDTERALAAQPALVKACWRRRARSVAARIRQDNMRAELHHAAIDTRFD